MAKKEQKRTKKQTNNNGVKLELKEETRHIIWGLISLFLGIIILLSIFNKAGIFGGFAHKTFGILLGLGFYLLPVFFGFIGLSLIKKGELVVARIKTIVSLIIFLSSLGMIDIVVNGAGKSLILTYGGYLGKIVSWPFIKLFGIYGGILILGLIIIISLIVLFDEKPDLYRLWNRLLSILKIDLKNIFSKKEKFIEEEEIEIDETLNSQEENKIIETKKEGIINAGVEYEETPISEKQEKEETSKIKKFISKEYTPPPISLLERDKGKANVGDMKGNSNIIQRTLLNFGISVEMDEVTVGPTVTRYALKPAQGTKLSKIVGLQNELALALAAHPIRIEAPIPGKSLVGIEIPNKVKSTVGLATMLASSEFQNSSKPLTVALGRGLSGKSAFGNLAKMPHMLVAGTTGSGKSVTIHSIITSLLYRNGPQDLNLIMVDPKRVELTLYNKIPHLLTPVITDPKNTILALKWAAKEMDRRYDVLQNEAVRDIESYNSKIYDKAKDGEVEKMPYIVIVIDELADIMQAYPRELESAIVRLAQMSRAVGIHLILSTQRPSVNVITGLIKANVPTRIALQVSSQIDSRTILDQGGAEKLLGAGDMLYSSAESPQPQRLQSSFISEEEVKKVVQYLKNAYIDEIPRTIELTGSIDKGDKNLFSDELEGGEEKGEDPLYEDARMIVIETGNASTSYLQRKLGVGYARAAKLIDMLEDRNVVGPQNGSKRREVFEKATNNTDDIIVGE